MSTEQGHLAFVRIRAYVEAAGRPRYSQKLLRDLGVFVLEHQRVLNELSGVAGRAVDFRDRAERAENANVELQAALQAIAKLPEKHAVASDAANEAMELARKALGKGTVEPNGAAQAK